MDAKWFAPCLSWSMAKIGMSLCVLGMAEEFKSDGIAVNALWPKTAIATAAVANIVGGDAMIQASRKESIMGDAAYHILTSPANELTGEFLIDEVVLKNEGVTDFSPYAVDPSKDLALDFFID